MTTLRPDDTVWLRPKTIGCPAFCWSQPEVTVVRCGPHPYVTVRMPEGRVVKVHEDNIARNQPRPVEAAKPAPKPRPVLAGGEEVPLW